MIVAIYKNGDGSSLEHHRTISQFNTAFRHFASIPLRRLVGVYKSCMYSNEAGFYPYRDYFDQILNLPEILVRKYTFHTLMQFVFPDYRVAFDSVDRVVLRCCLSLRCVCEKFISLIKSVHWNNWSRVTAYDDLSSEFTKRSGARRNGQLQVFVSFLLLK